MSPWGETAKLRTLREKARQIQAINIKIHISVSSPLQYQSQAVVCISTAKMYPQSWYFIANISFWALFCPRKCKSILIIYSTNSTAFSFFPKLNCWQMLWFRLMFFLKTKYSIYFYVYIYKSYLKKSWQHLDFLWACSHSIARPLNILVLNTVK